MNKEDIISSGLLELYALGLASPEERTQVEGWIIQYSEIKQELDAIENSLKSYAQAHAVEPSHSVRANILYQISAGDTKNIGRHEFENGVTSAKVYRIPAFFKIAAAALILLLIGSVILNYNYYNKYQSANNELQTAQAKMDQEHTANMAMKTDINIMTDKNALPVVLKGTPQVPDALAKIFWMKNTGDVYVDPSNLPVVPAGKQYQLWAIIDGKPIDGGMISTEKGIYHIQKMKSFGHADAFAITLEQTGGSPTPKGEMFVISKI